MILEPMAKVQWLLLFDGGEHMKKHITQGAAHGASSANTAVIASSGALSQNCLLGSFKSGFLVESILCARL